MQNVLGAWAALDTRRRVVVVAASVLMFISVLVLSQMVSNTRMELLYAGLEGRSAGEVVSALEQSGVVHEVRGNSIYVEEGSRDELRMVLAGQGLPSNGNAGYELLDNLSGFGTTSQMFDAAYWRAKEGELSRTIIASPQIRAARVHISKSPSKGFRQDRAATASVFVTSLGGSLSEAQARALRYLVASAVTGLKPDDVSVIDGDSGVVLGSGDGTAISANKREEVLKHNVERLLEARVGPGNAIVELSMTTVTDRESIVERHFDPEGRVAISSETEERTSSTNGSSSGAVTVASNLPDGDGGADGSSSSGQDNETRERTNFEVSQTQREIIRVPGAIKRLTVAVLVNATPTIDANGAPAMIPRPEAELEDLRSLISAAVGYDEARGDQITIRSLEFQPLPEAGAFPEPGLLDGLDIVTMAQIAVLSIVALILGLFVVRPIMTNRVTPQVLELSPPHDGLPPATLESVATPSSPGGLGELSAPMQVVSDLGMGDAEAGLPDLGQFTQDPVERLRQLIKERQTDTVEVLRTWMEEDKEKV